MRIIKLNAIDSTNAYLKQMSATMSVEDGTVVQADLQTNGRGQMGAVWASESLKNLTFSVFKDVSFLDLAHHHYISIAVSLAIYKALDALSIVKLSVKWPNDILSENKKIAGVLIENVIKHNQISGCIVGIGLNVNQTIFHNLPKASSLKLIMGKTFDLNEVLMAVLGELDFYFELLRDEAYEELQTLYESYLFRKQKPSTFKNAEGVMFMGYIMGVSEIGNLLIRLEDDVVQSYSLKEATLLY